MIQLFIQLVLSAFYKNSRRSMMNAIDEIGWNVCLPPSRATRRCVPHRAGQGSPDLHFMQQPAELAPLVRPQRMLPRIDGTLQHTSSWFRLRISRTLPRRLCIGRSRYRTPGQRNQSCPSVGLRTFGIVQDIRYKAGYSPSSSSDLVPGTRSGIDRTSASTANTPLYISQPSDLKSASDPPFFIKTLVHSFASRPPAYPAIWPR